MTWVPGPFNGEKTFSSINGAGTTGYPHAKEWSGTTTSQHVQKLIQNGSKTKM